MWSWRASIGFALALACTAATGPARAQAADIRPAFRVELATTQPGASIQLRVPGRADIWCGERCVLTLPQLDYYMFVTDAHGNQSKQGLRVRMHSQITVTPIDADARGTGVLLMGFGGAGIVVGGVALYFALVKPIFDALDSCGAPCADTKSPVLLYGGAITLVAGVALLVSGVVVWRKNSRARIDIKPLELPNANGALLRLTPVAGMRWTGLALTSRF